MQFLTLNLELRKKMTYRIKKITPNPQIHQNTGNFIRKKDAPVLIIKGRVHT